MPKLGVKTKPRIPPRTPHLAQLTFIQTPVALSVKGILDPLDDPRYLAAPIDILCESVKAPRLFSSHDIAEAYSTLSTKAHHGIDAIKDVPSANRIFAALEHIKTQAAIVCTAMRRDIRLAFVDPFLEVQPRNESSVASGSLPPSNTPAGTSFVERKLTAREEKRGRGRSLVCIDALGFISIVFRVGPFQQIFSCKLTPAQLFLRQVVNSNLFLPAEQLLLLLGDMLKITIAQNLPSLSAYKIRFICLLALQSQILPREVLAPKASETLKSLMKCVEKSPDPNFKVECFKVSIELRVHIPRVSQRLHTRL